MVGRGEGVGGWGGGSTRLTFRATGKLGRTGSGVWTVAGTDIEGGWGDDGTLPLPEPEGRTVGG